VQFQGSSDDFQADDTYETVIEKLIAEKLKQSTVNYHFWDCALINVRVCIYMFVVQRTENFFRFV